MLKWLELSLFVARKHARHEILSSSKVCRLAAKASEGAYKVPQTTTPLAWGFPGVSTYHRWLWVLGKVARVSGVHSYTSYPPAEVSNFIRKPAAHEARYVYQKQHDLIHANLASNNHDYYLKTCTAICNPKRTIFAAVCLRLLPSSDPTF